LALGVKAVLISSNFLPEEERAFGGGGGSKMERCQVEGPDELTAFPKNWACTIRGPKEITFKIKVIFS
jgi:hypothetical protein